MISDSAGLLKSTLAQCHYPVVLIGSSECTTIILVYYIILHTMETGVSDDLFDNIQGENDHLAKQGQVLRGYFY